MAKPVTIGREQAKPAQRKLVMREKRGAAAVEPMWGLLRPEPRQDPSLWNNSTPRLRRKQGKSVELSWVSRGKSGADQQDRGGNAAKLCADA